VVCPRELDTSARLDETRWHIERFVPVSCEYLDVDTRVAGGGAIIGDPSIDGYSPWAGGIAATIVHVRGEGQIRVVPGTPDVRARDSSEDDEAEQKGGYDDRND